MCILMGKRLAVFWTVFFNVKVFGVLWVCHFPIGILLGQVWYLIVSIPDLCTLTYIKSVKIDF